MHGGPFSICNNFAFKTSTRPLHSNNSHWNLKLLSHNYQLWYVFVGKLYQVMSVHCTICLFIVKHWNGVTK